MRQLFFGDNYNTAKEIFENRKFSFDIHLPGRPKNAKITYYRGQKDIGEKSIDGFYLKEVRRNFEPIICKERR